MCRSVLRVGWGRDQGLGAVPADISIPYGLYGRACGFSVGLVVKVKCKGKAVKIYLPNRRRNAGNFAQY